VTNRERLIEDIRHALYLAESPLTAVAEFAFMHTDFVIELDEEFE